MEEVVKDSSEQEDQQPQTSEDMGEPVPAVQPEEVKLHHQDVEEQAKRDDPEAPQPVAEEGDDVMEKVEAETEEEQEGEEEAPEPMDVAETAADDQPHAAHMLWGKYALKQVHKLCEVILKQMSGLAEDKIIQSRENPMRIQWSEVAEKLHEKDPSVEWEPSVCKKIWKFIAYNRTDAGSDAESDSLSDADDIEESIHSSSIVHEKELTKDRKRKTTERVRIDELYRHGDPRIPLSARREETPTKKRKAPSIFTLLKSSMNETKSPSKTKGALSKSPSGASRKTTPGKTTSAATKKVTGSAATGQLGSGNPDGQSEATATPAKSKVMEELMKKFSIPRPRRPRTPREIYVLDYLAKHKGTRPRKDCLNDAAEEWTKGDEELRKPYTERAIEDRIRYNKEVDKFDAAMRKKLNLGPDDPLPFPPLRPAKLISAMDDEQPRKPASAGQTQAVNKTKVPSKQTSTAQAERKKSAQQSPPRSTVAHAAAGQSGRDNGSAVPTVKAAAAPASQEWTTPSGYSYGQASLGQLGTAETLARMTFSSPLDLLSAASNLAESGHPLGNGAFGSSYHSSQLSLEKNNSAALD